MKTIKIGVWKEYSTMPNYVTICWYSARPTYAMANMCGYNRSKGVQKFGASTYLFMELLAYIKLKLNIHDVFISVCVCRKESSSKVKHEGKNSFFELVSLLLIFEISTSMCCQFTMDIAYRYSNTLYSTFNSDTDIVDCWELRSYSIPKLWSEAENRFMYMLVYMKLGKQIWKKKKTAK